MLDNNKCILTYGLPKDELIILEKLNVKVIEIDTDMVEMNVIDILKGIKFKTFNPNPTNEKVILFNNFSDVELQATITEIRKNIIGGLLAVVTPISMYWKFDDLLVHLIEEREWHLKYQKGRG